MKKSCALGMALVLALGVCGLGGCGKKTVARWQNYDASNFIEDTTQQKVVKDKITLKLFAPIGAIQGDWNEMALWKKMEEVTNVHIDWESVPLTGYSEKRPLKWLDTENPVDGFFLSNTMSEVVASKNRIAPLDELVDKYAPNYKALMEQYPEIKKVSSYNGNMYIFCSVNSGSYGEFALQYINKKWLDKVGLDVPQTVEELYEALKAFKQNDVNGNGNKNDEVPISYFAGDSTCNFISTAFGLVGTGGMVSGDEIIYGALQPNYREYVKFMNRLYGEGLLDSNVFSNKSTDLVQKGQNNTLGCFADAAAYLMVGTKNESDYVPVGPLTSAYNSVKSWYQTAADINPNALIINNDTPFKRELTKWMDVLYTEAGAQWQVAGLEGRDWTWDSEEHTTWTLNVPDGADEETYRATLTYTAGIGSNVYKTEFANMGSTPLQQRLREERAQYLDYLVVPMPQLTYSVTQSSDISDLTAQLDPYIENMFANFVKGNKDPSDDKEWNSFISTLKQIGVERLLKIYNDVYAEYRG